MKIQWLLITAVLFPPVLYGQELEARAYANLPKGMNVVAAAYAFSKGSVLADASLPIEDFTMKTHNMVFAYVRTFGLANKLARIQVAAPLVHMSGTLKFVGQDTAGTRTGLGDIRVRFGINLLGSPALARKDFGAYTQKTIFGFSLVTSIPTGQYFTDKQINIGNRRWGFKPEIGVSKRYRKIYADGYIGMWFYTSNNAFMGTKELEQRPILSSQLHFSYYFKNAMMIGLDGNWFNGGKTFVDENQSGEQIRHSRLGNTWALPIKGKHLVRCQFHTTIHANAGYNYNLIAVGYQYIFF